MDEGCCCIHVYTVLDGMHLVLERGRREQTDQTDCQPCLHDTMAGSGVILRNMRPDVREKEKKIGLRIRRIVT